MIPLLRYWTRLAALLVFAIVLPLGLFAIMKLVAALIAALTGAPLDTSTILAALASWIACDVLFVGAYAVLRSEEKAEQASSSSDAEESR